MKIDRAFTRATREARIWFILFLVVMLGGAIRKWFTTSGVVGNLVLLVQMVLPFLIYSLASHKAKNPFAVYPMFTIYFVYLVLQIFNPLQVTLFHGVLGVLVHGMFWMGIFFYLANRDLFQLDAFLKIILVMALGEVVLAFVQYGLPQSHILNKYALDTTSGIAIVGDRVRVTGTFSYLSGYTAFLLFYPFFVWALIFKRVKIWLVFTVALAGMVAAFMTGSRGGVVLYLVFVFFGFYENYRFRDIAPLIGKLVMPVLVVFTIFLVVRGDDIGRQVETAYTNFSDRVTGLREKGEESKRLTWDFHYFEGDRFKYPLFGIGTGATYQGATILFGTSPAAREFGYVESEFVKVVLEGGFLLIILKMTLAAAMVQQLCFGGKLFKFTLWFTLVYAAPIVFNVHNATFLMLGLIYIDSAAWQFKRQATHREDLNAEAEIEHPVDAGPATLLPRKEGYPQVFDRSIS